MSRLSRFSALMVCAGLVAVMSATGLAVRAQGPRPTADEVKPEERIKQLVTELEQLRQQLLEHQPAPVGSWKVTGKVKGNIAELKIVYGFTTDRENASVALGCKQGFLAAVLVDGKMPSMRVGADGLVVEVPEAKAHEAVVDVQVPLRDLTPDLGPPLVPRGLLSQPVQGLELSLPLASVTSVDLELPAGVKALEVNGKALAPPLTLSGNRLTGLTGKAEGLKLTWPALQPGPTGSVSVLTARASILVQLLANQTNIEAELTLQDLTGLLRDWQLQVPDRATVRPATAADRDRLRGEIQGSGVAGGRVTVPLQIPSTTPLKVIVSVRLARSASFPVGPFQVDGASNYAGMVWVDTDGEQQVRCQPYHLGRVLTPPFEVAQRSVSERKLRPESERPPVGVDKAFQFWSVPTTEKPAARDPWFTVNIDATQGALDTQLLHTVRVKGKLTAPSWRVATTFDVVPLRSGVDHLEVEWPTPWEFDRARGVRSKTPGLVTRSEDEPQRRTTRFEFASESLKPFELTVEAEPGAGGAAGEPFPPVGDHAYASAVVPLPRPWDGRQPRETQDRGGHLITVVDDEQKFDFRVPQPANPSLKLVSQEPHKLVWQAEKFPSQVAVAWQPYQADLRVDSSIEMVFESDRARVRHRFQFAFPDRDKAKERDVELRIPPGLDVEVLSPFLAQNIPVKLQPLDRAGTGAVCTLPVTNGTATLVLGYRFSTSALFRTGDENRVQKPAPVPLVLPAKATTGEMRVQIWEPRGMSLRPVETAWTRTTLEQVATEPTLPSIAFRAGRPAAPLHMLGEANGTDADSTGLPDILVEKALIHVQVNEAGYQEHTVRFLLGRVAGGQLDLRFPIAWASLDPRVSVNGKQLNRLTTAPGDSEARIVRVDQLTNQKGLVEVRYRLAPGQAGGTGALRTVMQPVTILGVVGSVQTRWWVDLPAGWVPLSMESGPVGGWQWGFRGWLLAARPSTTVADLYAWLGEGTPSVTELLPAADAGQTPSFVCWRGELGSLTVYHAPQQAWLLVCSLGVLVLGLTLSFSLLKPRADAPASRLLWPLLALFGLTATAVGLVWPGMLAALFYGCQPGLVVLAVVLIVQVLLNERYRRRVVFLPGFRRVQTGSSLVRAGKVEPSTTAPSPQEGSGRSGSSSRGASSGLGRVRREPSTVDAPQEAAGDAG